MNLSGSRDRLKTCPTGGTRSLGWRHDADGTGAARTSGGPARGGADRRLQQHGAPPLPPGPHRPPRKAACAMSEDELNTFAAALRGLTPAAAVDRDALMFAAGRASAPRRGPWPLAAAASALVAV